MRGKGLVQQYRERRMEALRRYAGVDSDPESIPRAPREPVRAVLPPPEPPPAEPVRVAG